jgi:hypothetical protein
MVAQKVDTKNEEVGVRNPTYPRKNNPQNSLLCQTLSVYELGVALRRCHALVKRN